MLPYEIPIRLAAFAGVLVLMAAWELLAPRRHQAAERPLRWSSNLGIVVLDTVLVRILVPATGVGIAFLAEARGWGLFHAFAAPAWLAVIVSVIALDLAIYLQHVLFHAVPALWRLHRMHHADLAFDVTTGVRFHPIEILLSMLIKLAVVAALGAPALAVVLFEVVLNATSMFNHGNVRVPERLDRMLRWIVVTPDMHRVHHSVEADLIRSAVARKPSRDVQPASTSGARCPRAPKRSECAGITWVVPPAAAPMDFRSPK